MRKLFLSLVAILLCSLTSFAQRQIWTAQDFNSVGTSGNYKLMADINLGVLENAAIKSSFSGTFDGNGHTITYQASYNSGSFGLFQSVDGTIKNLTVEASVTFGGSANHLNVGLLCGSLGSTGLLQSCNVTGVINSTAVSSNGAGTDSGLLVGESSGTIKYCIGNGSVAGIGHVGGLIGRMNGGSVLGSAFTGSLYAIAPGMANGGHSYGSVAGGICGAVEAGSSIKSCFVKADIVAENANNSSIPCLPYGIASDHIKKGDIDVLNNYCEGTLNGEPIDAHADVTNSNDTGNNSNYYPGYGNMSNQEIVNALNTAKGDDPNINFGLADDEDVIFGVVSTDKVCETPTNLTIANNAGAFTASWTSATADTTITESHWHWSLTGGDAYDSRGEASSVSVNLGTLPASSTPYTFMVYTDCSETVNGLTSSAISQQFYVDCPAPTALTASNITDNGFTISWTASVDCQLTVNGINYEISAGNPMTKQITGLNPETPYTAIVKAKCGNAYVKQASINVTTARLYAPTGLTVTPTWQSTSGKIVVTWDMVAGLTYEIEGEAGDKVTGFEKTGLSEGAYTLKLRAKKGEKTSEWVSMPYTISNPEAPKNPIVTYTQTESTFRVSINWDKGVESATGWKVGENNISKPYVLESQTPGESFDIEINEISSAGTSAALVVPIQVPCLRASRPTSIVPSFNSVTFNFDDEKTREIVISMQDTTTNATSVTIDSLTEGTSYACEIREYCNVETNTYSSIDTTFSTLACNPVANLSVSNVGQTSATVSWTSQSSTPNLQYKVVVNGIEKPVQTNKTINLTGLTLATTYTVRVSEQCGEGWGEERTITFTTQGAKTYISAKTGNFSDGATWIGGQIPSIGASETASITINAGHTVTLDVTFVLRNNITFTNNGVLSIGQAGELINTTSNNVGGIVEIVTPIKAISKWTFIGAPFESGYKLGSIKPVSGSDVAMVEYNYTDGEWSNYFVNYETTMAAAEGAFAWPFYGGVITFSTYDLGQNGTSYPDNAVADYELNNDDVPVSQTIITSSNGNWMALANPYPAKLDVEAFLTANSGNFNSDSLQGKGIYVFNGTSFEYKQSGDIEMTEGFFVNFASAGDNKSVTFTKNQLSYNQPAGAKASANEFIELTLQNGNDKVRVYFAHNEDAEQGYDILDANKMFATTGVAEPYFVTDGIALIKEEVRDLPYYATMNVRSQEDTVMNFVLTNLPEGYAVSIIDGEEVIDMVEGGVYSTEIASGENADRFKVLVKKNVGLADVEELDVRITNSNRHITITAQENVRTEVYNTLGQKVFETEETNFVLSGVASGAYVVKVQGAKASKSQKIVVE